MSDQEYEYILRGVDPDGTVIDESHPHIRSKPFRWAGGLGQAILRAMGHPDVVAQQLRRPVGSDDAWEPIPQKVPDSD